MLKLVKRFVADFGLDETEAIQIVNCMPTSTKELRIFLAGGRRIVETTKLEAMLNLLNEHRKLK
jgi:DNA-directed RNA polymerase subunit F